MFKAALTTAIVLATASVAFATEFDPNPANRYQAFQTAPVALLQGRNVALTGSQAITSGVKTYDREGANLDGGTSR